MLPAYCDPPNPCPIGYTSADGCIEDFENTSEFSRRYQASQKCICDTEHMFDCPEENAHRGPEDIAAVVRISMKKKCILTKCIQNVFWIFRTSWLILTAWYPQIPTITLTWTDKNCLLPPKKAIFEASKRLRPQKKTTIENFSSSSSFILKYFNFHHYQQSSLKREQFQPKCLNQVTILKTCLLNILFLQLQSRFLLFRLRILTFEQNYFSATQIKSNPNWSTSYFCKMCKLSSSEIHILLVLFLL